jgi:hypothetical protein
MSKSYRFDERDDDYGHNEKKRKIRDRERRRTKKMKNAFRSKNLDAIMKQEEEDEYYNA